MRLRISHLAASALLALSLNAVAEEPAGLDIDIGLLLPLTGPLAGPAAAVKDGFLAAHKSAGGKGHVRVYDTAGGKDSAMAAYRQALKEDAKFIVGPLSKEAVTALADDGRPDEPVLALNYLDKPDDAPRDFYQFGLAPEDEARAAAERAVADGDRRALVMAPDTDWGKRVTAAFEKRLTDLGGSVVQTATYAPGTRDYSKTVRELMKLDASEARHKALTGIIGTDAEFEPRRRDDIDFIFMPARAADARLLWPQFRFFRATDLPVYATAQVYEGRVDTDLVGVRFCDMPWMVQRDDNAGPANAQQRLFALGHDAYLLASLIQNDHLDEDTAHPGYSGSLKRADRAIVRGLVCARFRNDKVEVLSLDAPGADE